MSLIGLPEGVENITLSKAGTGKPRITTIFESSKERIVEDLDVGIREAKGRYHGEYEGAASADNPVPSKRLNKDMNKPFSSTCWRPLMVPIEKGAKEYKPKLNPKTGEELVRVFLKCKGTIIDKVLADMGGNPAKELQIDCTDLVKTLEHYKGALEGMEKDSPLGQFWWDNAVHNSFPPKQRKNNISGMAHCMEEDKWVAKGDVKKESSFPSKAIG